MIQGILGLARLKVTQAGQNQVNLIGRNTAKDGMDLMDRAELLVLQTVSLVLADDRQHAGVMRTDVAANSRLTRLLALQFGSFGGG